jgi:predicted permease
LLHDASHSARRLGTAPAFAATAVLTFAVGIAASVTLWSAYDALVLRPLPLVAAGRLVAGVALRDGFDPFGTSLIEFAAYRRDARGLSAVSLSSPRSHIIRSAAGAERIAGAAVTAGYFETLGVVPAIGRTFTADDARPGVPAVVLLSHALWRQRFGEAATVLGTTLDLDERPHEIVGVLPSGFDMPYGTRVWTPLQIDIEAPPTPQRSTHGFDLVARLAPGVTLTQAAEEVAQRARRLEEEVPDAPRGWGYRLLPLRQWLLGDLDGRLHRAFATLAAGIVFLLLVTCANVAGLLIGRGVARRTDMSVRLALGATRGRLVRQMVAESVLLALIGAGAGILTASWALGVLSALLPVQPSAFAPLLRDLRIDAAAVGVALAVAAATALVVAAIAAVGTSHLRSGASTMSAATRAIGHSRRSQRGLAALVTVEAAAATVLLVVTALLARSAERLNRVDLGFQPDQVTSVQLSPPPIRYPTQRERSILISQIVARIETLPGVDAAGVSTNIPLQAPSADAFYEVEGRPPVGPAELPVTAHRLVSAAYPQAIGLRLLRGRWLDAADRAGAVPVVLVSETLARQAWPGADPVGKRLRHWAPTRASPWLTVVGIVGDVKEDRFNFRIDRPVWYLPYAQHPTGVPLPLNLIVRSTMEPDLASAIRAVVAAIDPGVPLTDPTRLRDLTASVLATERFAAVLSAALGWASLVLAAGGLYGVVAFVTAQRTGELAVRLALGATSQAVAARLAGRTLAPAAGGVVLGLVVARVMAESFAHLLYRIAPGDLASFCSAAGLVGVASALACAGPAAQAMRVDPVQSLKHRW